LAQGRGMKPLFDVKGKKIDHIEGVEILSYKVLMKTMYPVNFFETYTDGLPV
jgi:hypothetical protein